LEWDIRPVIPSKINEDRAARPVEFDREQTADGTSLNGWSAGSKNVVVSALAMRNLPSTFLGMLKMAFIQRYLSVDRKSECWARCIEGWL
jgi:hypothetical protein